jgi:hypothetical protein
VGLFLTVQFGLWASAFYILSGVVVTCVMLYLLELSKRAEQG